MGLGGAADCKQPMKPTRRVAQALGARRRRRGGRRGRPAARRPARSAARRLLGLAASPARSSSRWPDAGLAPAAAAATAPWASPTRSTSANTRPRACACRRPRPRSPRCSRGLDAQWPYAQGPAAAGPDPGRRLLQRLFAAGRLDRGRVRSARPGAVRRRGGVRAGPRAGPRAARPLRQARRRAAPKRQLASRLGQLFLVGAGRCRRRAPTPLAAPPPGRRHQRLHPLPGPT